MNVDYVVCNEWGEIRVTGTGPIELAYLQAWSPGWFVRLGKGIQGEHYVDPKIQAIVPLMTMKLEVPKGTTHIRGLPPGSMIRVNDTDTFGPVDDGTMEFEFKTRGLYICVCTARNYRPTEMRINVE